MRRTRTTLPTGEVRGASGRLYGKVLPGSILEVKHGRTTEYIDLATLRPVATGVNEDRSPRGGYAPPDSHRT
jgi:hypothetical protein